MFLKIQNAANMLIYAIVSTENNGEGVNSSLAGMNGLTGACLFAVSFNDVSAVVSEVSSLDFPAQQTNAIEYAGVIETLVQRFTLLPVRFGSIMESAEAIRNMLEKNYYGIQQNLIKVQNKF